MIDLLCFSNNNNQKFEITRFYCCVFSRRNENTSLVYKLLFYYAVQYYQWVRTSFWRIMLPPFSCWNLKRGQHFALKTLFLPLRLKGATTQNTLTLSLLMSYIYGAPCKARNFNVVYIYIYAPTFGNAESSLFLFAAQCFNTESMQKVILCHSCV
jgi:hypothetical protein